MSLVIRQADRVTSATLACGDVIECLDELPGRIDLTITSPPYNLGKEYGVANDERTYHDYLRWTEDWVHALYDATADGGRLCLNLPVDISQRDGDHTTVLPLANVIQQIVQEAGWAYQTTIDWCEGNIGRRTAWGSYSSPSAPFVTNPNERILVFYKGERWKRAPQGRTWDIEPEQFKAWTLGSWTFPGASAKRVGHPAPFPEELPRRLILLYSYREDVICDPFVGSGTTCRVAQRLGRNSIGIDSNPDYLAMTAASIRNDSVVIDRKGERWVSTELPMPILAEAPAA